MKMLDTFTSNQKREAPASDQTERDLDNAD